MEEYLQRMLIAKEYLNRLFREDYEGVRDLLDDVKVRGEEWVRRVGNHISAMVDRLREERDPRFKMADNGLMGYLKYFANQRSG